MEKIDNKARAIQEVANELGWNSDVDSLIERVKQIDNGLISEDEFIYLLNWLPNCILVNKLDQSAFPNSESEKYGVPDLLAVFEIDGKKEQYLIEVKTSRKAKLSWTEKYVNKLKAYSELVGIPILIAWKCHEMQFTDWVLVSLEDFSKPNKTYKLNYIDALKQSRLSKYTKDYTVTLPDNFSFELSLRKDKHVKTEADGEIWDVFLESLKITGRQNQDIGKFSPGLFALFMSLGFKEELEENKTHIIRKWKPYNVIMPIHRVVLIWGKINSQEEASWIERIQNSNYPISYDSLFQDLSKSIDLGLVNHILFTIPAKN